MPRCPYGQPKMLDCYKTVCCAGAERTSAHIERLRLALKMREACAPHFPFCSCGGGEALGHEVAHCEVELPALLMILLSIFFQIE